MKADPIFVRVSKTLSDGSHYEGEWRRRLLGRGRPHGDGKFKKPNGDFFVGEFSNGSPVNGKGKLSDGAIVYEGEFSLAGEFGSELKLQGLGKIAFSNGFVYEGEFTFGDAMNGHGKMTGPDGNVVHEGMWKHGQPATQEPSEQGEGWEEPFGIGRLVNLETEEEIHMPLIGLLGGAEFLSHSRLVDIEDPKTGEIIKVMELPAYVKVPVEIRDEKDNYLGQIKFFQEIRDGGSESVNQAEIKLPDLSRYEGEVSDIFPNGIGTLYFSESVRSIKITGKWDNGVLLEGAIYFPNGDFFRGGFKKGLPRTAESFSFHGEENFSAEEIDTIISELDSIMGEDPYDKVSLLFHWQERLIENLRNLGEKYKKFSKEGALDKLLKGDESQILEFKSSIWASYRNDTGEQAEGASKNLKTEDSVIKTIAAFLNTEGGTLAIGIQDRPERKVVGIEADFAYSGSQKDIESFQNSLSELVRNATGEDSIVGTYVKMQIREISGKNICLVIVEKRQPKYWTWVDMKTIDGGSPMKEAFFVRSGPQTKLLRSKASAHEWRTSSEELRGSWNFD